MMDNEVRTNLIISRILRFGSILSIIFMVIGLILYIFSGGTSIDIRTIKDVSLVEAFRGLFNLNSISYMTIGVVILLLTPILRVIGAIFTFLYIENDKKYALISFGVLIILLISMFIPGIR